VQAIDINPSVAYRLNNWISLGAGVSAQHFSADLSRKVNLNAVGAGAGLPPVFGDADLHIHGESWAMGYNFGALVEPIAGTRIGLAYRSQIDHRIDGGADFTLPAGLASAVFGGAFPSSHAHVGLTTPDRVTLSLTQTITPQLRLVSDVEWTGWGNVKTLTVNRDLSTPLTLQFNNRDAMFASLGAIYTLNPTWTLRAGVAYDQTPVTNEFRTTILPDQDRYIAALGVGYQLTENIKIDAGYLHFFVPEAGITNSVNAVSATGDRLVGKFNVSADEIALSMKVAF
jgi:long-chain fatty acid transport protein